MAHHKFYIHTYIHTYIHSKNFKTSLMRVSLCKAALSFVVTWTVHQRQASSTNNCNKSLMTMTCISILTSTRTKEAQSIFSSPCCWTPRFRTSASYTLASQTILLSLFELSVISRLWQACQTFQARTQEAQWMNFVQSYLYPMSSTVQKRTSTTSRTS